MTCSRLKTVGLVLAVGTLVVLNCAEVIGEARFRLHPVPYLTRKEHHIVYYPEPATRPTSDVYRN